ncbi:hypothetical protein ACI780_09765 [Geodermatophilus sp. SYSU D00814]
MGRSRAVLALAVTPFAMALAAVPATAAAGNGAQVILYDYCDSDDDGGTFCASGRSVYRTTETPSGNVVAVIETDYVFSYSGTDCSYATSGQDHGTSVLTASGYRQAHGVQWIDSRFSCGGRTEHCVTSINIAYAAGVIRHDSQETTCESS